MSTVNTVWYVKLPGETYANSWEFTHPVSECEVRTYVRDYLGLKRLPRGTQVWAK